MKNSVSRRIFLKFALSAPVVLWASQAAFAAKTSTVALSTIELSDLLFMREEEKVARDVYITLYNTWGHKTFEKISKSEQQHMDTMKKMLDKYGVADPAQPIVGAFTNPVLQNLYTTLVAQGSTSLIEALKVGCTIEEVDMIDLQRAIDNSTHSDLDRAYQSLMAGSANHLEAFVTALAALGVSYTPQYISQEMFDEITKN
jgi:hypothetical protein